MFSLLTARFVAGAALMDARSLSCVFLCDSVSQSVTTNGNKIFASS
jgi:hypothetical protein